MNSPKLDPIMVVSCLLGRFFLFPFLGEGGRDLISVRWDQLCWVPLRPRTTQCCKRDQSRPFPLTHICSTTVFPKAPWGANGGGVQYGQGVLGALATFFI